MSFQIPFVSEDEMLKFLGQLSNVSQADLHNSDGLANMASGWTDETYLWQNVDLSGQTPSEQLTLAAARPKPTDAIFTDRPPFMAASIGLLLAGLIGLGWNVSQHWPYHAKTQAVQGQTSCASIEGNTVISVPCLPKIRNRQ